MASELQLPPGFRFHPTDEELVMHYLCRKCASQPIAVPIIAEIDLYKYDPWYLPGNFQIQITAFKYFIAFLFYYFICEMYNCSFCTGMALYGEKEWYFFSPRDRKYPNGSRPNRSAGTGYWKATGADKPIGKPKPVGIKKALVFYAGKAPKGEKTNWIMHEYRLAEVDRSVRRKNSLRVGVLYILIYPFSLFKYKGYNRPFQEKKNITHETTVLPFIKCYWFIGSHIKKFRITIITW